MQETLSSILVQALNGLLISRIRSASSPFKFIINIPSDIANLIDALSQLSSSSNSVFISSSLNCPPTG